MKHSIHLLALFLVTTAFAQFERVKFPPALIELGKVYYYSDVIPLAGQKNGIQVENLLYECGGRIVSPAGSIDGLEFILHSELANTRITPQLIRGRLIDAIWYFYLNRKGHLLDGRYISAIRPEPNKETADALKLMIDRCRIETTSENIVFDFVVVDEDMEESRFSQWTLTLSRSPFHVLSIRCERLSPKYKIPLDAPIG